MRSKSVGFYGRVKTGAIKNAGIFGREFGSEISHRSGDLAQAVNSLTSRGREGVNPTDTSQPILSGKGGKVTRSNASDGNHLLVVPATDIGKSPIDRCHFKSTSLRIAASLPHMAPASQTRELVASALAGSDAAMEALYVSCGNLAAAQEASVILFTAFDTNRDSVGQWLQTLAGMHPELAAPLGMELRRRLCE